MWSVLAQLGGTFLSFLVPLVIFLVFKDRDPFVRRHSASALNFHITLAIAYIVLAITVIGLLVIPFLWLASLVLTILASIAANDGRDYQYPMSPEAGSTDPAGQTAEEPAHHGVGEQPSLPGQHHPAVGAAPADPSTSPSAMRPATAERPAAAQARRRPGRRRRRTPSSTRSSYRWSSVSSSRPAAG